MKKSLALLLTTTTALFAGPSLTVYNQNFAVVRDTVPLDLQAGANTLSYSQMTAQLEPDSVILRDPAGKVRLQILEQSYRNDPVSQGLLLSMFEGQEIDFFQKEFQKPDAVVRGKILRSGYSAGGQTTEPVIELDGKIRFGLPGLPLFPSLKDDAALNPTLNWVIQSSQAAKLEAEIAYVTGGFTWEASYNLVAPEKGDVVDFTGWVTVNNQSGKLFKDATVKLMAGDVNKVQPQFKAERSRRDMAVMAMSAPAEQEAVTEKAFDEFHLYSVARPMTLRDKETKQVEFVRAQGVKSERIYVYDGALIPGWRVGSMIGDNPGYGTEMNKKVNVFREFKNSEENKLGIPLPKGRVRFYTQDETDRSLQFVGENNIDHTAKNELVRLYVGDSFDLVGERRQTDYKVNSSNNWATETIEIKVRNRKKESAEIRVVEHLYRWLQWEIQKPSQAFEKRDSQTIEFRAPLKPDEEKLITYTVRYTW